MLASHAREGWHRAGSRRCPRHAFTLIELLVVIVIVAVLAGMALPRMAGSFGAASLRGSARDLLTAVRMARSRAATHGTRCRLVIAPEERRYRLEHEPEPRQQPGRFEPLRRNLVRGRELPDGVSFATVRINPATGESASVGDEAGGDDQLGRITFRPDGSADTALIQITDGERTWTLRIAGATGRAELTEGAIDRHLLDRKDLDA